MHLFSELVWVWLSFWEVEMICYLPIFMCLFCHACSLKIPVQLCAETHWFTAKTKLLAQSVWARERERGCVSMWSGQWAIHMHLNDEREIPRGNHLSTSPTRTHTNKWTNIHLNWPWKEYGQLKCIHFFLGSQYVQEIVNPFCSSFTHPHAVPYFLSFKRRYFKEYVCGSFPCNYNQLRLETGKSGFNASVLIHRNCTSSTGPFFKILQFHRRKKVIWVLIDMRVSKW